MAIETMNRNYTLAWLVREALPHGCSSEGNRLNDRIFPTVELNETGRFRHVAYKRDACQDNFKKQSRSLEQGTLPPKVYLRRHTVQPSKGRI